MGTDNGNEKLIKWKACVALLEMIYNRECQCDRAKCAAHFEYLRRLKFEYECKIDEYETKINPDDPNRLS